MNAMQNRRRGNDMARLIDADALMNTIIQKSYTVTDYWNSRDAGMFLVGIEQAINEQPTIEERKTGKWIVKRSGVQGLGDIYICPFCKHEVDCTPENFCGNCGADMR